VSNTRSADALVGVVLSSLITLAEAWVIFELFRYRADSVASLSGAKFNVMPIASVLLRLIGEVLAIVFVALGMGLLVLALFAAARATAPTALSPFLEPRPWSGYMMAGMVGGLVSFFLSLIGAFVALVAFYFLAELTLVLADIANDVSALRGAVAVGPGEHAPIAVSDASGGSRDVPATSRLGTCPACHADIDEPNAAFCTHCGTPLKGASSLGLG
jgi:hypothetical protein